jgi:hypothetical protein
MMMTTNTSPNYQEWFSLPIGADNDDQEWFSLPIGADNDDDNKHQKENGYDGRD